MIAILACISVLSLAGFAPESIPQEDFSSDIHRTIGAYAGLEYLDGKNDQYPGFSVAGFFRPIKWTEVGIGYSSLATNDFLISYVQSWVGMHSPRFWKLQFTGGAAVFIPAIVPSEFYSDCSQDIDPSIRGYLSPFLGMDMLLKDNSIGYQYNLRTRVMFKENSLGRISVGCYILN